MSACVSFVMHMHIRKLSKRLEKEKRDYDVYYSPLKLFASSSLDANESLRTHEIMRVSISSTTRTPGEFCLTM